MGDSIKIALQIDVHNVDEPIIEPLVDLQAGMHGRPLWPVAIGAVLKVGLEEGLDHQPDRRLHDPVADRGNP